MEHIHMEHCQSTQDEISKLLESNKSESYLVSANSQKLGRGQRSKSWFSVDNALAMSFNLEAANTMTLTSLEIGVLVAKFFSEKYEIGIGLKWPNDLYINGLKCGGILIQKHQFLICGIGLNLNHSSDYPKELTNITTIYNSNQDSKSLAFELYQYVMANRLSDADIKKQFQDKCIHTKKLVSIIEENKEYTGRFLEIGNHGEARVLINSEVKNFYSASLVIHN